MIRKLAGWIAVVGLIAYIVYFPAQAADAAASVGGSIASVAQSVGNAVSGFADRLGQMHPAGGTPTQAPGKTP